MAPFDQIFDVNRSAKENGRITRRKDGGEARGGLRKRTLTCLFPGTTTFKRLRHFTRANEIETMHGCSRVDIKVEPHSPFMFTRGLSYNASDFIYASKFYVRLQNWVVTSHHQYGIFALAPQTSFRGMETISGVVEVSFFLTLRLTNRKGSLPNISTDLRCLQNYSHRSVVR